MFGFRKSKQSQEPTYKIPSMLECLFAEQASTELNGSVSVEWTDSELAYAIDCKCLAVKTKTEVGSRISFEYVFDEKTIPSVLKSVIPARWSRELQFNSTGHLIEEQIPSLVLCANESTVLHYDPPEADLLALAESEEILLQIGSAATPLRSSERDIKLAATVQADTHWDSVLHRFSLSRIVDVKYYKNGPFRGGLLMVDELAVLEHDGSLVSIDFILPPGPWWLMSIRGRFNPPGVEDQRIW